METESDPIIEYKASLNDLSFNSKPLINMLTMLSEDYKDSKAPQIVRCIEERLHTVSADKKLPLLYLLDSICKNVGHIYVTLFTQNIVSTFCDTFAKVDEKTRLSLYKLRQTWSSIFPPRKLYAIDHRIHSSHDPAWPITAPKPDSRQSGSNSTKPDLKSVVKQPNAKKTTPSLTSVQQQVHINPKFLNDKNLHSPISTAADPQADLAAKLIQKQNELLQIQKQKLEFDLLAEKRKLAEQARALQEKEMKLKQKEQQMLRSNSPNGKKIKKRKRSRSQRSRTPSPVNQKAVNRSRSPAKRWSQSPNERTRESPHQSPSFSMRQNKVNRIRSGSPSAAVKPFVSPTSQPSQPIPSNVLPSSSKAGVGGQPPVPTTIPAPTILAQPELLSISRMDNNVVPTMSSMSSIPISSPMSTHNVRTQPMNNTIDSFPSWGKDRDYRRDLDTMMTQANEKLRSGAISRADHEVLVREVQRIRDAQQNQLKNNVQNNRIISEPQDTLTMLVDGKLRKLFYLDDTTAVVLLNAPQNASFDQLTTIDPRVLDPRQISFEGKPTFVYIDSERPTFDRFLLDFNGQEYVHFPKDPSVPSIPQRIKFGGPAKEIILNGQPFPAKFGGPPIQVWFEGDNSGPHSIKLDGPTPRVKLSDERRYDLWNQIINKATTEVQTTVNNTKKSAAPPQAPDINSLLSKLMNYGMLDTNKPKNEAPKEVPKEEKKEKEKKREKVVTDDPPIQLTSDSLKISRPGVVADLYRGIQCTNCSLRFDDKGSDDKTRYSKHLDWHFRQNRRDKAKPNSSATSMRRNWYYPLNLWIQFKEVTDEEDTTGLFQSDENESDVEEEQPLQTVIAEKDESLNFCAVCQEKFDHQWNEDEEEWRLLNAVKHNNRIYHPLCLNDHISQTERLEQQISVSESVSDINENKANVSEESIKSDVKHELNNSDHKCDNTSDQNLSESVLDDKTQSKEVTEDNVSEVKPQDKEVTEEEEKVLSESSEEETNIKVIEYEIPLNSDNVVKHDLTDILEDKNVEDMEQQMESEEEKTDQKVVLQQGGIVIKMKASNLPIPTAVQQPEPMETNDSQQPEVIVRGQELSSLCNIM